MRHRLGTLLVAATAATSWVAIAGSPAEAEPVTTTFGYTGAEQSWTVPDHVCSITADLYGAQGGANPGTNTLGGSLPGLGGHTHTTFTVTPGEELAIVVGGRGGDAAGSLAGDGGFGGGGDGGFGDLDDGPAGNGAGGGGGASAVTSTTTDLVVVAGGGGGAGNSGTAGEALGGAGGGASGGDGTGNLGGENNATGGTGGTLTTPGAPGVNSDGFLNATAGQPGLGGTGGSSSQSGGGGGGGGFTGGGGGGGAANDQGASAGGGGGSGFTVDGTGMTAGVREGDGEVTFTYEPSSSCTAPSATPNPPAAQPLTAVARFTG
jgi:hypothetical protein